MILKKKSHQISDSVVQLEMWTKFRDGGDGSGGGDDDINEVNKRP